MFPIYEMGTIVVLSLKDHCEGLAMIGTRTWQDSLVSSPYVDGVWRGNYWNGAVPIQVPDPGKATIRLLT